MKLTILLFLVLLILVVYDVKRSFWAVKRFGWKAEINFIAKFFMKTFNFVGFLIIRITFVGYLAYCYVTNGWTIALVIGYITKMIFMIYVTYIHILLKKLAMRVLVGVEQKEVIIVHLNDKKTKTLLNKIEKKNKISVEWIHNGNWEVNGDWGIDKKENK